MFEAIKHIQDQEDKARQALIESTANQTATDSDTELPGEWTALPNSYALEEISLANTPPIPLPAQPAQVVECSEAQLAKVVGRQILASAVTVSVRWPQI
jgi:hypothetical protein